MRLIKEEYHLRLFEVADLRQLLKKLRQHPQQECAVDGRTLNKALAGEDVDVAAAVAVGAHPVVDIKLRLTEEQLSSLSLEGEKRALDSADGRRGHIAVLHGELRSVLPDVLEHCPKVLEVEQQQARVVCHLEYYIENARLNLRQTEQSSEQCRPHFGHSDTHGVTHLTEDVPESCRVALVFKALDSESLNALLHILAVLAGHTHSGKVALDIREKNGHPHIRERLGHNFHCNGLACAGRACYQAVAVSHLRQKEKILIGLSKPDFVLRVHISVLPFHKYKHIISQLFFPHNNKIP